MTFRRVRRALLGAISIGLALPGIASAGWSEPGDLPVTRADQVEATMSPQGTATVAATQIAGPTDVYGRGPKRGAAFRIVRSVGPCADVANCPFDLDAGAERGWNLVYDGKYDQDSGVSSQLTAYLRSATGSLSETVLEGPTGGVRTWEAQVASNGTKRALAIWRDGGALLSAIKDPQADGFGARANLAEANVSQPQPAIGKRGTAAIVGLSGPDNMRFFRHEPGGDWEFESVGVTGADLVASAVNARGWIYAAFNSEGSLWIRTWRADDSAPRNVETLCFGGPAVSRPQIEIGPDDKPWIAFVDGAGDLKVTPLAGTCRRAPTTIKANSVSDFSFDVRGSRAVLAWVDEATASTPEQPVYGVRARAARVGGLGRAKTVRVGGNPDQVSAGVDAEGDAIVAYRRTTESRELGAEVLSYRAPRRR